MDEDQRRARRSALEAVVVSSTVEVELRHLGCEMVEKLGLTRRRFRLLSVLTGARKLVRNDQVHARQVEYVVSSIQDEPEVFPR